MPELEWFYSGLEQNSQITVKSRGLSPEQEVSARKSAGIIRDMHDAASRPEEVIECIFDKTGSMCVTKGWPLAVNRAITVVVPLTLVSPATDPIAVAASLNRNRPPNDMPLVIDVEGTRQRIGIDLRQDGQTREIIQRIILHKRTFADIPFAAVYSDRGGLIPLIRAVYFLLPFSDRRKGFISSCCCAKGKNVASMEETHRRYDFFFVRDSEELPVLRRKGKEWSALLWARENMSPEDRRLVDLESNILDALLGHTDEKQSWEVLTRLARTSESLSGFKGQAFVKNLFKTAFECGAIRLATDLQRAYGLQIGRGNGQMLVSISVLANAMKNHRGELDDLISFIKKMLADGACAIPWLNRMLFEVTREGGKQHVYTLLKEYHRKKGD